jgi:hypothetical protein
MGLSPLNFFPLLAALATIDITVRQMQLVFFAPTATLSVPRVFLKVGVALFG